MKPYKAKSLKAAEERVRRLQKQWLELNDIAERYLENMKLLAKLAADGPAFLNPLEAMAAKKLRDEILATMRINPDGSFK